MARAAFRKAGSLPIRVRDELGCWYEDGDFAAVYPVRGAPGISPAQLAVVTVLQFCENLTDRQAAGEARGRVGWKYCLGLELAGEGSGFTALNGFRERLLAGGAERVLSGRLLGLLKERGLVKAGGRQRTDSTHVLARIRQYYRDGGKVIGREEREHGLPPGRDRLVSPYDLDARYPEKHGMSWLGYKGHFTETVSDPADDDPDTGKPALANLVTDVQTTHAAVPGVAMTAPVHDSLEASGLLPGGHDADSGYVSADLLVSSRQRGITLAGPLPAGTSARARGGGYTAGMFAIGFDARQATCPHGTVSSKWAPLRKKDGKEAISVRFPAAACRACPARDKCTTAKWTGRQLFLRPREIHEAVAAARAEEDTRQWKDRYKARAGVEGLMYQATHVTGIRRARYTGLDKTRLEHLAAATAINVIRLDAWYSGPLDRTRTTHLQRIHLASAA